MNMISKHKSLPSESTRHWRELPNGQFEAFGWELIETTIEDWREYTPNQPFADWFHASQWIKANKVYRFGAELDGIEEVPIFHVGDEVFHSRGNQPFVGKMYGLMSQPEGDFYLVVNQEGEVRYFREEDIKLVPVSRTEE